MVSDDCHGDLLCTSTPAGRVCVQACQEASECDVAEARCTPVAGVDIGWCDTSERPLDEMPVDEPPVEEPPVEEPPVEEPPVEVPEVRGDYPEGPFGKAVGDVIMNHEMVDLEGDPITLGDLRTDASVKLLLIFNTVTYCRGCAAKTAELTALFEELGEAGLLPVVALYENNDYQPAQGVDAERYKRSLDLEFPVLADSEAVFQIYFAERAHPMVLILDAENMTILYKMVHWRREEVDAVIREQL